MKTMNLLKKFTNVPMLIAVASVIGFSSCEKDDIDGINEDTYTLAGNASGSQVVPAVTTTATGSITGSYNALTNQMQYNISWSGLAESATDSISIYGPAAAGANGTLIGKVAITTAGVAGSAVGGATLTEEEESALLDNAWYFVVGNSTTYPGGEIRGQISATKND